MAAIEGPFASRRSAQTGNVEANGCTEEVQADGQQPQQLAKVALLQSAGDGQHAARADPDQDALEVSFERLAPESADGKEAAPDLDHCVGATHDKTPAIECVRESRGHE